MDAARVAAHYRGKGYTVHESYLATGHSGNNHRVPLLCEGPLGNLAVFFGDAAGVDGHELGAARRVAKDLGATPVVAAATFTAAQRAQASELGVVLLDADAAGPGASSPTPHANPARPWPAVAAAAQREDPFADHPWPDSGRREGRDRTGPRGATFEVDDLLRELDASPPSPRPSPPPRRLHVDESPQAENRPEVGRAPNAVQAGHAPNAVPAVETQTAEAQPARPVQRLTSGDGDGLWRRERATAPDGARNEPPQAGAAVRAEKFAWLGLAQEAAATEPLVVELEHEDVVGAQTIAAPRHEHAPAASLSWNVQAARLRRRLVWAAVAFAVVVLFALWWF